MAAVYVQRRAGDDCRIIGKHHQNRAGAVILGRDDAEGNVLGHRRDDVFRAGSFRHEGVDIGLHGRAVDPAHAAAVHSYSEPAEIGGHIFGEDVEAAFRHGITHFHAMFAASGPKRADGRNIDHRAAAFQMGHASACQAQCAEAVDVIDFGPLGFVRIVNESPFAVIISAVDEAVDAPAKCRGRLFSEIAALPVIADVAFNGYGLSP